MTWMITGAIVAIVIILTYLIIGFTSFGKSRSFEKTQSENGREQLSKTGLVLGAFVAFITIFGLLVPNIYPGSTFAVWIEGDYSNIIYTLWCILIAIAVGVILTWCGLSLRK